MLCISILPLSTILMLGFEHCSDSGKGKCQNDKQKTTQKAKDRGTWSILMFHVVHVCSN